MFFSLPPSLSRTDFDVFEFIYILDRGYLFASLSYRRGTTTSFHIYVLEGNQPCSLYFVLLIVQCFPLLDVPKNCNIPYLESLRLYILSYIPTLIPVPNIWTHILVHPSLHSFWLWIKNFKFILSFFLFIRLWGLYLEMRLPTTTFLDLRIFVKVALLWDEASIWQTTLSPCEEKNGGELSVNN